MKFYKVQKWDYMDANPTTRVIVFSNEDKAREHEKHMNEYYSGGTTKIVGAMDSVEAANYVRHLYNREKANPQHDSRNYLLNVAQQYKKCYGKDVISTEELMAFPCEL